MSSSLALIAVNTVVASALLAAGIGKLVGPRQLVAALAEVVDGVRPDVATVRAIAVFEVAVATALLVPAARTVGAVGLAALALGFLLVGVLGMRKGSTRPCGCMGDPQGEPFGPRSAGMAVAFAAVSVCNLMVSVPARQRGDYSAAALSATACGAVALCVWRSRRRIRSVLGPSRSTVAGRAA
jgi:hypothetical protein